MFQEDVEDEDVSLLQNVNFNKRPSASSKKEATAPRLQDVVFEKEKRPLFPPLLDESFPGDLPSGANPDMLHEASLPDDGIVSLQDVDFKSDTVVLPLIDVKFPQPRQSFRLKRNKDVRQQEKESVSVALKTPAPVTHVESLQPRRT